LASKIDVSEYSFLELTSQNIKDAYLAIDNEFQRREFAEKLRERAVQLRRKTDWERWFREFYAIPVPRKTLQNMSDLPLKGLDFGEYGINEKGISIHNERAGSYDYFAKSTPVIITKQLDNIDGEPAKVELSFKKRGEWLDTVCDLRTISDTRSILNLSDSGISVNSLDAPLLVRYFSALLADNIDVIPIYKSTGRMGWHGNEFIPYGTNYVFDGSPDMKRRYEAICEKGDFDVWLQVAEKARKHHAAVRFVLASSLASALLKKMQKQLFFVHMWSKSGVGKSVALSAALSVWGDPERLFTTFNATNVGTERLADFNKNIPLCLDELQTVKDKHYDPSKFIYQMTSGVNKIRGTKEGGLIKQSTWQLIIITNGEQPITEENSNSGVKNRVLEIYCAGKMFDDFDGLLDTINNNYGHAGRKFVEYVKEQKAPELERIFQRLVEYARDLRFEEKQLKSVAIVLLADYVFNVLFLSMNESEAYEDTIDYIRSNFKIFDNKDETSLRERAYSSFVSWVLANNNRFKNDGTGEVFGTIDLDEGFIYILPTAINKWCAECGYNKRAILTEFDEANLLAYTQKDKRTRKRICGAVTCVYKVKIPDEFEEDDFEETDIF
jgi:uncharacterized protein (DUF927 family)